MKFIIDNWVLISVALLSGSLLFWPMLQGAAVAGASPAAVVQLMNRERAQVVDVSSIEEFAAGHIGGARHLPLDQLDAKLANTLKNKKIPLVLVCQTGARSARAVAAAKALGFEQVQSLAGGLAAWKAANLPVEKA